MTGPCKKDVHTGLLLSGLGLAASLGLDPCLQGSGVMKHVSLGVCQVVTPGTYPPLCGAGLRRQTLGVCGGGVCVVGGGGGGGIACCSGRCQHPTKRPSVPHVRPGIGPGLQPGGQLAPFTWPYYMYQTVISIHIQCSPIITVNL